MSKKYKGAKIHMTTKNNKQVKQPFYNIGDKVYIKPLKVKGVVKGHLDGLTVVTYFIKGNRRTNKFELPLLRRYKEKIKSNTKLATLHPKEYILSKKEVENFSKILNLDLTSKRMIGNLEITPTNKFRVEYHDHNPYSDFFKVREFQKAFNCPAPDVPTVLSDKLAINRASFVLEEVIELLYATAGDKDRFDKFFAELILNAEETYKKQLTKPFPEERLIGQIDALIDIKYFAEGGLVETSVVPDRIFDLVHQANMSKIFSDGKPHYDKVGKVIKPEGWEAPEPKIEEEVKRQIKLGAKRFN
jgi:predicted HAD superfamily Cof-like phosphohydrolase